MTKTSRRKAEKSPAIEKPDDETEAAPKTKRRRDTSGMRSFHSQMMKLATDFRDTGLQAVQDVQDADDLITDYRNQLDAIAAFGRSEVARFEMTGDINIRLVIEMLKTAVIGADLLAKDVELYASRRGTALQAETAAAVERQQEVSIKDKASDDPLPKVQTPTPDLEPEAETSTFPPALAQAFPPGGMIIDILEGSPDATEAQIALAYAAAGPKATVDDGAPAPTFLTTEREDEPPMSPDIRLPPLAPSFLAYIFALLRRWFAPPEAVADPEEIALIEAPAEGFPSDDLPAVTIARAA